MEFALIFNKILGSLIFCVTLVCELKLKCIYIQILEDGHIQSNLKPLYKINNSKTLLRSTMYEKYKVSMWMRKLNTVLRKIEIKRIITEYSVTVYYVGDSKFMKMKKNYCTSKYCSAIVARSNFLTM